MNTNETIQTAGTVLANELKAGNRGTASFVKLVADTHGIDVEAMQSDILAVINREFSKTLCSASEPALAAYASFRGAFTTKRFNRYVIDGAGGIVTVSFADPSGTPKDSKARFVTVDYLSPVQLEQQAKQAERDASKAQATAKTEARQHAEEKEITRTAMTATQVLARMLEVIPEISALTDNDLFTEWEKQRNTAAAIEQGKRDKQTHVGKSNQAKRKDAADKRKDADIVNGARIAGDAAKSNTEIQQRNGTAG